MAQFVSQTATNGYVVGNNAFDGLTKQTAKLTLENALATGVAGDVITINDGVYNAASFYNPDQINQTINAENDYMVTLTASTNATRIIHVRALATGMVFGKIIFDALNFTNDCITTDSSNNVNNITFNGTDFRNYKLNSIFSSRLVNLTATGMRLTASGASRGLNLTVPAAGLIDIDSPVLNITNNTGTVFSVIGGAAGVVTKYHNASGSINTVFDTVTFCFQVLSCETHFYNNINLSVSGSLFATRNHNIASDVYIYGNTGISGAGAGASYYGIRIGDDGAPTTPNQLTIKRFENNDVSGFDHSFMMGYITGGSGNNMKADLASIGFLIKECTNCNYSGCISERASSDCFQMKACTSSTFANCMSIISSGYDGIAITANSNGGRDNLTCSVNNMNTVTEIDPTKVINVASSQDVALNNHNHDAEVPFTGNIYTYSGIVYGSAAALNGNALVKLSTELSSGFVSKAAKNYTLVSASPLVGIGIKWWGTNPRPSTLQEPSPDSDIDVGAYQSKWSANHPANL